MALKDDMKEIEKAVYSLNLPVTNIAYIKTLDNNQAIVFFEHNSANIEYFGNIRLKKNLMGWKLGNGSSGQVDSNHKLGWNFSDLKYDFSKYTDVLSGKILDSNIKEVFIVTKNNKRYQANIVNYNNGKRFWYLITEGEELPGSMVRGMSMDGKIIDEINL